jgi:hypothetical protein
MGTSRRGEEAEDRVLLKWQANREVQRHEGEVEPWMKANLFGVRLQVRAGWCC